MARVLSDEKLVVNQPSIGKQLLDVVTSGMYDNPLMVYREYIQNAVDSIDAAIKGGRITLEEGNIFITLDGENRQIIIEDNGGGISNDVAVHVLKSLGVSPKEGSNYRGFRGIGRLGGLAYCDELVFETRASGWEKICLLRWDRKVLEQLTVNGKEKISLEDTVNIVSEASFIEPNGNEPASFFRVSLRGVRKFHSDSLMNMKAVFDYLAQVAPVPYNKEAFIFSDDVHRYFSVIPNYRCYNIHVNGKKVFRPYSISYPVSKNRTDTIHCVEYFSFSDESGGPLALGWYGKTDFLASLPSNLPMRGIRVRQGNIEVGDERLLEEIYTESRFAGWIIGEIHIFDGKLKPNARRDGFEISRNYERFLEHAKVLGRQLSVHCRQASIERNNIARIQHGLTEVEAILDSPAIYLNTEHTAAAQRSIDQKLTELEILVSKARAAETYQLALTKVKRRFHNSIDSFKTLDDIVDGRKLRGLSKKDVLQHVASHILKSFKECRSADELVSAVISQFVKDGSLK